ncbi:hypothetical protein SUGI_0023020 [Cryptomeria japonica]|nr:hypothetical protein SUGI_0023020 [Cryptomeria japonica]
MADILQLIGALSIAVSITFICSLLLLWKPYSRIPSLKDKHVVITGGSSGIGLAIAKEALAQGAYVTMIARNLAKLEAAAQEILHELQCEKNRINIKAADVRNYEAISAAINESFQWRPFDVILLNAGVGSASYMDKVSIESIDTIVGTNLIGTLYTLRVALPLMKEISYRHPSALVLVGSLASLYPAYGGGVYTCTKYALRGLAENLRLELLPYKIAVSFVCPGFVETAMLTQMEDSIVDPVMAEVARKVTFYSRRRAENSRDVAKATLKAVTQGRSFLATGWKGSLLFILSTGILPADSFAKAVLGMIVQVPARVFGYLIICYVYAVIWVNHRTKTIIIKNSADK